MKAEIKEHWEPFTVEILVESKDDARELWHRLSIDLEAIKENLRTTCTVIPKYAVPSKPSEGVRGFWVLINNALDSMARRRANGTMDYSQDHVELQ